RVAESDPPQLSGIETRCLQRGDDPRSLGAAHPAGLVVEAFADTGLDEDPAGRRLDQEAVQGLEEAALGVDLVADPAIPEHPRDGPEQRSGVGADRPRPTG